MTQSIRADRTTMPAAQDETQTDDALNAAVVRLLTRPEAKGPSELAGPAEPEARIYGIDAALHHAVDAHRNEVERQMRDGAETDGDDDANMDRLASLADVIRATPISTLADLRHKMIYLWSGKWPESGFFVGELQSTLDSIRQDIMKLADADAIARTASQPDPFTDPNRHEGFIPMPAYKPTCFMEIQRAIPLDAQRLLDVAQAQFERRVPAYAGFPQEERDAHIARMRSEYRLDQLEVLTWAKPDDEPVVSQPATDDAIGRAIAAHRLAYARFDTATRDADEVAVAEAGGDTSVAATAAARKTWQAAHEAEEAAFEAVLALRPNAPAGLAAMLRYIAETPALGELDSPATAVHQLAKAAEAVAASAKGAKISQAQVRNISVRAQRDPVLALIEEHHVAFDAWAQTADTLAARTLAGPARIAAEAAERQASARERVALDALMTVRPTTLTSVLILAEYLPSAIRQVAIDDESQGERALSAIAAALRDLVPSAEPSADLITMVEQWQDLGRRMSEPGLAFEAVADLSDEHDRLQFAIYRFPSATVADLHAKVPVFRNEMDDALRAFDDVPDKTETLPGSAWLGLFRDFERLNALEPYVPTPRPLPASALDVASMTLGEIEALYDMCDTAQRLFIALSCLPGGGGKSRTHRVARSYAAKEADRLYELMGSCAAAAAAKTPIDQTEMTSRKAVLARHAVERAAWDELRDIAEVEGSLPGEKSL